MLNFIKIKCCLHWLLWISLATSPTAMALESGLDVLLREAQTGGEHAALLSGKRIGLVTNMTGVDRQLRNNVDLLAAHSGWILAALFGPEHGVRGDAQAGVAVENAHDPTTGLPVYSLYGKTHEPTPDMLAGLDILVFDIQDIGARFYTYPYTLASVLRAAKREEITVVVLDRPNPIGGILVEGPILDPEKYASFVGMFEIPIRHGMTIGELARLFNEEYGIGAQLHVVPMTGWERADDAHSSDALPWVMPSPNMPTPETALVYPGTGLLEGTNLSEGRGTTRPFEIIGAPFIDARQLADALNAQNLPGVRFRPLRFTPTFSKHAGESCGGVRLHLTDRQASRPVRTAITLLLTTHQLYPQGFTFTPGEPPFFDRLVGNGWLREAIEGQQSLADIEARWQNGLSEFETIRQRYLLY